MRTIQRSVETWRELVGRQNRSGLSGRAYCQRERLNAWTTSTAGGRGCARAQPWSRIGSCFKEQNREPAGFIDLGALSAVSSRCEIRLEMGGGVVQQAVRG